MENFITLLQVLGGGFAFLLTYLGGAKLIEKLVERKLKKNDDKEELHATNQGKMIDSEIAFRQSFVDRLGKVETKLETVQDRLNSQLVMNAELKAENQNLKDDRGRLNKEVEKLRDTNDKQAIKIINLENELHRTQDDVKKYKQEIVDLNKRFDDLDKTKK